MYVNRKYMVEFLELRVHKAGHSNILESFLYVTHRSVEFIAMMRANAIIDLLIARPMRWLAGKGAELEDFSPFSMGVVLELIEVVVDTPAAAAVAAAASSYYCCYCHCHCCCCCCCCYYYCYCYYYLLYLAGTFRAG